MKIHRDTHLLVQGTTHPEKKFETLKKKTIFNIKFHNVKTYFTQILIISFSQCIIFNAF